MKALFPDWRAQGVTVCLHEHQGGFAFNLESVLGLVAEVRGGGRRGPLRGRGDRRSSSAADGSVERGRARPRAGSRSASSSWSPPARGRSAFWSMLGLPDTIDVRTPVGRRRRATGRCGRTGTCRRARSPSTRSCSRPPTAARRRSSTSTPTRRSTTDDGELVTDELWGIYFKRDRHGVQGGASPLDGRRRRRARPVPVDDRRRPGLPGHVVRGALARDGPLRGLPAALQAGALRRRGRVHGRQLPGLRLRAAERLRRSSTRTTATR